MAAGGPMARIDQMQSIIDVMANTLAETAADMARVNGFIVANTNAASANAAAIDNLMKKSNAAWEAQEKRITDLSAELDKEVDELQDKVRRVGGGAGGPGGGGGGDRWNLEHKGAVKTFGGKKDLYKDWAKKIMTFCNSKQNGFRKALKWAAKHPTAIDDAALAGTQWEHIMPANTKLYDLLSAVCESDA